MAVTEKSPASNSDFQWAEFDSESYFQHYYGEPHRDDDLVIEHAVAAMKEAAPKDADLHVVDVGTGPNLIPFFAAMARAKSLTAWEYAQSNVDWLKRELASEEMRPQWRHFWPVARRAYGAGYDLPDNPIPALRAKAVIVRGSIFDLPARRWDAATMFFCAESITERQDEFEAACARFAGCVKPGGALIAAFLVRSGGYVVAEKPFPVLHLNEDVIQTVFERHADAVKAELIGIVEREIRSGYAGFIFLTGTAR